VNPDAAHAAHGVGAPAIGSPGLASPAVCVAGRPGPRTGDGTFVGERHARPIDVAAADPFRIGAGEALGGSGTGDAPIHRAGEARRADRRRGWTAGLLIALPLHQRPTTGAALDHRVARDVRIVAVFAGVSGGWPAGRPHRRQRRRTTWRDEAAALRRAGRRRNSRLGAVARRSDLGVQAVASVHAPRRMGVDGIGEHLVTAPRDQGDQAQRPRPIPNPHSVNYPRNPARGQASPFETRRRKIVPRMSIEVSFVRRRHREGRGAQ